MPPRSSARTAQDARILSLAGELKQAMAKGSISSAYRVLAPLNLRDMEKVALFAGISMIRTSSRRELSTYIQREVAEKIRLVTA